MESIACFRRLFVQILLKFCFKNVIITIYLFNFRGEIQSSHLGCDIRCWDAETELQSLPDEHGDLVCLKPFPSMPVNFWNDPEGKAYGAAYFDKFKGKNI